MSELCASLTDHLLALNCLKFPVRKARIELSMRKKRREIEREMPMSLQCMHLSYVEVLKGASSFYRLE